VESNRVLRCYGLRKWMEWTRFFRVRTVPIEFDGGDRRADRRDLSGNATYQALMLHIVRTPFVTVRYLVVP
jgi:hypothetical protein